MIKIGDMLLAPSGVSFQNGEHLSWENLCKVLMALPEEANKKLGWFSIMGPRAYCSAASDEVREIVAELLRPI